MTRRCEYCKKFTSQLRDIYVGAMPQDGPTEVCLRCYAKARPAQVEVTDVSTEENTVLMVGPSKAFFGVPEEIDEDRNEDDPLPQQKEERDEP